MSKLMAAHVTVSMPYDSQVSVNSAYNRNNPRLGYRKRVKKWLMAFKCKFNLARSKYGLPMDAVQMDITIHRRSRGGRRPDTSNFRKLPQDAAAAALGIDDNVFSGTDHPIILQDKNEWDSIEFEFTWIYKVPNKARPHKPTKMSTGPLLGQSLMRRLGIKEETVCVGFGSAYCMICSAAPEDCPVQYSPEVYMEDNCPCASCNRICPCKGIDLEYTERKGHILTWWQSKLRSTKFESRYWRQE